MDDSPFDTDPALWEAPKPITIPPPMPVAEVVATMPRWRMGLEPPPRVWTVFVAFGIFVSLLIAANVVLVALKMGPGGLSFEEIYVDLDDLLMLLGFSVCVSGGTAIFAAVLSPEPFAK